MYLLKYVIHQWLIIAQLDSAFIVSSVKQGFVRKNANIQEHIILNLNENGSILFQAHGVNLNQFHV